MTQGFASQSQLYNGMSAPTRQIFTSGSGTYTTPSGVLYIEVALVGSGAGGSGGGTSIVAGTIGNNTTFGGLTGTAGAVPAAVNLGGLGGAASGGDINIPGGGGGGASYNTTSMETSGGLGGSNSFGGSGNSAIATPTAGGAYGTGGSGGGADASNKAGGGGGSGGYCFKEYSSPDATYSYSVGASSAGGVGSVTTGGASQAGIIVVTEYYQLNTHATPLTFTGTGDVMKNNAPNQIGVTDASNAAAGSVGEVISSEVLFASKVSLTTATVKDVTSISLSAGDWDVWGNVFMDASGEVMAENFAWVSSTATTINDLSSVNGITLPTPKSQNAAFSAPYKRFNVSGTTTVYLSCRSTFASGTVSASGTIYARRAR